MGRKLFNACMFVFMMVILTSMVAFCIHKHANTIDRIFDKNVEITQENEPIDTLTIEEFLNYRQEVIECNRVDGIFLTIPEKELIKILEDYGTDLSNHEIVYIYESKKYLQE